MSGHTRRKSSPTRPFRRTRRPRTRTGRDGFSYRFPISSSKAMGATISIEEVTAPEAIEAARRRAEQGRRNAEWLEDHWPDLLPHARGKFIAVAGGEAFVAETVQAAWSWVAENHPKDGGASVQYVPATAGPRIYAHRRHVAHMR